MIRTTRTVLTGAAAALGLGLAGWLAPATAQAAPADTGTVTVSKLTVRSAPSTHAKAKGSVHGRIPISCKVAGTSVQGNRTWYLLPGGSTDEWVSAAYMKVSGSVPECGPGKDATGRSLASRLVVRSGPTTADEGFAWYNRGETIKIICKVRSTKVDGNSLWYHTRSVTGAFGWVSARYVSNVGAAPAWCTN